MITGLKSPILNVAYADAKKERLKRIQRFFYMEEFLCKLGRLSPVDTGLSHHKVHLIVCLNRAVPFNYATLLLIGCSYQPIPPTIAPATKATMVQAQ